MDLPSISIITATLNAASTLANNLQCIQEQSISVEHLLIDGGSFDTTLDIAKSQGQHLKVIVSESDSGIYDAMNKGISFANGDIIGILNADDLYASESILEEIQKVFRNPEVDACYGDLEYVRSRLNGQALDPNIFDKNSFQTIRYWKSGGLSPHKFYSGWMPPHPTFFVRRSVYEKYGLFNLDLGTAADYEIMLRFLLKHRIKTIYIPEVLVKMRVGGASNRSLKARLAANRNDRKAWEVNGLKPYPWTIPLKPLRKIPQYFLKARD